jgi:acyl carrier protein
MNLTLDPRSQEAVETWLAQWLADELTVNIKDVQPDRSFLSYGMNSVQAMMLAGDLEDALGRRLSPTLAWEYRNVEALARHVVEIAAGASAAARNGKHPSANGSAAEPAAAQPADPEALLARIDEMSEAEMDSLLQGYLNEAP